MKIQQTLESIKKIKCLVSEFINNVICELSINGFRVVNVIAGDDDKCYHAFIINRNSKDLITDIYIEVDYIKNDYKKNPNGEDYIFVKNAWVI